MHARSALFDVYGDHLRTRGNQAPIASLVRLLAPVGIGAPAVRTAVSRMVSQGWLAPVTLPAGPGYRATDQAVHRLAEAADRIYRRGAPAWDGQWRLAVLRAPRHPSARAPLDRRRRPARRDRAREPRRRGRGDVRGSLPPRARVAQVPLHRPGPAGRAAAGSVARPGGRGALPRRGDPAGARRHAVRGALPCGRMTDMNDPVLLDVSDGVATITLNRPDAMNSLDVATKEALLDAVRSVADDPAARCVVLTGTGRAFCVGQDLKEHIEILRSESSESLFRTVDEHYNPIVTALATMAKPVVAALN